MSQYLLAVHGSEDQSPYMDETQMHQAFQQVDALNAELQQQNKWVFGGGLMPASSATVVKEDGTLTDGPYLESKEHIGGFWVIEAADLDEALAWARKASVACMNPVEVRPFQPEP